MNNEEDNVLEGVSSEIFEERNFIQAKQDRGAIRKIKSSDISKLTIEKLRSIQNKWRLKKLKNLKDEKMYRKHKIGSHGVFAGAGNLSDSARIQIIKKRIKNLEAKQVQTYSSIKKEMSIDPSKIHDSIADFLAKGSYFVGNDLIKKAREIKVPEKMLGHVYTNLLEDDYYSQYLLDNKSYDALEIVNEQTVDQPIENTGVSVFENKSGIVGGDPESVTALEVNQPEFKFTPDGKDINHFLSSSLSNELQLPEVKEEEQFQPIRDEGKEPWLEVPRIGDLSSESPATDYTMGSTYRITPIDLPIETPVVEKTETEDQDKKIEELVSKSREVQDELKKIKEAKKDEMLSLKQIEVAKAVVEAENKAEKEKLVKLAKQIFEKTSGEEVAVKSEIKSLKEKKAIVTADTESLKEEQVAIIEAQNELRKVFNSLFPEKVDTKRDSEVQEMPRVAKGM